MSFLDEPAADRLVGPARLFFGSLAAAAIPALISPLGLMSPIGQWMIFVCGLMAVFVLYLPLILWRHPRSERPLLTCVALGMLAAPGPFGFAVMLQSIFYGPDAMLFATGLVVCLAVPHGAFGGFIFWLCAVWRNPAFAPIDPA